MLKDISIGRYYQGDSVLHRMDPRFKTILFLFYTIVIFMLDKPLPILGMVLISVICAIVGRLPLKVLWNTVKPVIPIVLMIFVLNIFTIGKGNTVFEYRFIKITDEGLIQSLLVSFRLLMMILFTGIILTLTTTPLKLSEALEKLFAPLKIIKVPVHELAMMMSIALRFIPTLIDETDKIMKAQVSRGADYDTGSFVNRLKGYVTVLIPLFISSFRRAEELAIAMDARCYNGGEGRTKLNPLHVTGRDILLFVILCLAALFLLAAERYGIAI